MPEGSPPPGSFGVFTIPFPCSILCIMIVLLWGSSETKLSLIPARPLGTQQRLSYRVLLHPWVLDHGSCPHLLTPE